MADSKLTGLTANTTPALTDLTYLVDDPGGTPLSQKITVGNLLATPNPTLAPHVLVGASGITDGMASLSLPSSEAAHRYYLSTVSADEGGGSINNTMAVGWNFKNGSRVNLSEPAWYLQWETKFSDLMEFHFNYISDDGGTSRRLFASSVNRTTHATDFVFTASVFEINSVATPQLFSIRNDKVGVKRASPVSQFHVEAPGAVIGQIINVPTGNTPNILELRLNDTVFAAFPTNDVLGWLNLTAPSAQGSGSGMNFVAGSGKAALFQLDSAGNMVFRNSSTGGGTYVDYQNGQIFFRNLQAAGATRMTLSGAGELTIADGLNTGAPSGGTAAKWKMGTVASVSPTSPNRTIQLEVGGTTYFLHAKTTND